MLGVVLLLAFSPPVTGHKVAKFAVEAPLDIVLANISFVLTVIRRMELSVV